MTEHSTLSGDLQPDSAEPDTEYGTPRLIGYVRGHGGAIAHLLSALGKFQSRHGH